MKKKPYKTIVETSKGRNIKSVNTNTGKKSKNKELIKKVENKQLPKYSVVRPANKKKFLRSKADRSKKNNLDPKIKA